MSFWHKSAVGRKAPCALCVRPPLSHDGCGGPALSGHLVSFCNACRVRRTAAALRVQSTSRLALRSNGSRSQIAIIGKKIGSRSHRSAPAATDNDDDDDDDDDDDHTRHVHDGATTRRHRFAVPSSSRLRRRRHRHRRLCRVPSSHLQT